MATPPLPMLVMDAWLHTPQTPQTLAALAQAITHAAIRTQAQLDKERITAERATKLRPRKAQAEPIGLFAQEQLSIFGQ